MAVRKYLDPISGNWVGIGIPGVTDHNDLQGREEPTAHPQYLLLAGGSMSGALALYGDPATDLEAAPKRYVDNRTGAYTQPMDPGDPTSTPPGVRGMLWVDTDEGLTGTDYLPISGGVITGSLEVQGPFSAASAPSNVNGMRRSSWTSAIRRRESASMATYGSNGRSKMPIFQRVEGVWKPLAAAPKVFDGLKKKNWVNIDRVYVRAQGYWRPVWPDTGADATLIDIRPIDAVWPEPARVKVTIIKNPPEGGVAPKLIGAPSKGAVLVVSQEWTGSFHANLGSATFTLPVRNPGTYPIGAVWSEDSMIQSSTSVKVSKTIPTVTLEADPTLLNAGEATTLTIGVSLPTAAEGAGGYTELQWQEAPGGAFGPWREPPFTGVPRAIVKIPPASVGYRARITGHPRLEDTNSAPVQITRRMLRKGSDDVEPIFYRTYDGGGASKQDGIPLYHGYSSPQYGRQRGFAWLPALADTEKICTRVEVVWHPQHTFIDTSAPDQDREARIAFGLHLLDEHPISVDYADSRIGEGRYGAFCNRGETFSIDIAPLIEVVNLKRDGGFGIIVGHDSMDQRWYGYGYPVLVRYFWEKWV